MKNNGFTLIEMVLTIVIVSILSIPISIFICEIYKNIFLTSNTSTALELARNEMEIVTNTDFSNINTQLTSNSGYDISRTISFVAPSSVATSEKLKKILIEVRRTGKSDVILNLVTYRADNISYGY